MLGLDAGYPLVPLMAFTPYVAAAALLAAAAMAIARRLAPAGLALAAGLALGLLVAPRVVGDAAEGGVPLRVMTANMKLGGGDAQALVDLVRAERVDVLTVQELTAPLARELRRAGLERELPNVILAPAPLSAGGGLYSRLPASELSEAPGSLAGPQPAAAVDVEGVGEVLVFSFHPPPPTGPDATREWEHDIGTLPEPDPDGPPVVIAGDFNATLDHAELREVLDRGYVDAAERAGVGLFPTWPDGRLFPPQVTIDHVLASAGVGVADASVHELPDSDHRAVSAELLLEP